MHFQIYIFGHYNQAIGWPQGMQSNKLSDDVEGNPDRVDPFYQQGK